jgi:hypothetical protein
LFGWVCGWLFGVPRGGRVLVIFPVGVLGGGGGYRGCVGVVRFGFVFGGMVWVRYGGVCGVGGGGYWLWVIGVLGMGGPFSSGVACRGGGFSRLVV